MRGLHIYLKYLLEDHQSGLVKRMVRLGRNVVDSANVKGANTHIIKGLYVDGCLRLVLVSTEHHRYLPRGHHMGTSAIQSEVIIRGS